MSLLERFEKLAAEDFAENPLPVERSGHFGGAPSARDRETSRPRPRHSERGDDAAASDSRCGVTLKKPISAPRCFGSAAISIKVWALQRKSSP